MLFSAAASFPTSSFWLIGSCCVKSPEATCSAKRTPFASGPVMLREKRTYTMKATMIPITLNRRMALRISKAAARYSLRGIVYATLHPVLLTGANPAVFASPLKT